MNKQEDCVSFSLDSTKDFEDIDLATRIVAICLSLPPTLRPTKFGAFAPLKGKVGAVDEIVSVLVNARGTKSGPRGGSLLLRARSDMSGYSVQWSKSARPGFSGVMGWIMSDVIRNDPLILKGRLDGVRRFVEILSPSYGEVRLMSDEGDPRDLTLGLPEVPAISIYGKEYIDFFGATKIEGAPFLEVEKVGACYWLVAQKSIIDKVPSATRASIRSYLGEDAFVIGDLAQHKIGRAPKFDLSNSLYESPVRTIH
jgi:hypothetical protein